MNLTFQEVGLLQSCLISLILTPLALTKWLTQTFVDFNRFKKGGTNQVGTEWTLKRTTEIKGVWIKQEPN